MAIRNFELQYFSSYSAATAKYSQIRDSYLNGMAQIVQFVADRELLRFILTTTILIEYRVIYNYAR